MNVLEKILEEINKRVDFRERLVKYGRRRGTITDVCTNKGALEELDIIAKIIRSHMDEAEDTNVPSKDGWIPVGERLPEETGYYLVQLSIKLPNEDYSDRVVVLYNGEEKEFMCYASLIIAWQPLPEPYRRSKKEKSSCKEHIMSRFMKVE